jgi:NitT/TauT family transport system permease protein
MKRFSIRNRKFSIISGIIIIILWISLCKIIDNEVIFPGIKATIVELFKILENPSFLLIVKSTILRSLIGFLFSLILAMLLGILASVSNFIYYLMKPVLSFLTSTPTMAIIILALIWLDNEIVPMFVGFIMVFPILYETALNSILNIDENIIQMAKIYKVNRATILKDIYLPSIFYSISMVFTSALGINMKMVIAGEVLSQPRYAIGSNLQLQKTYLNTAGVFAWIIIILLISRLFKYIMEKLDGLLKLKEWRD